MVRLVEGLRRINLMVCQENNDSCHDDRDEALNSFNVCRILPRIPGHFVTVTIRRLHVSTAGKMSDMGIWTKPRRTLPRKDVKGLERRNYAYRTAKTYVRIVREFAEHFQQPPAKRGPEQIQHIGPICSRPTSYRLPRSASTFQRYVSCLS